MFKNIFKYVVYLVLLLWLIYATPPAIYFVAFVAMSFVLYSKIGVGRKFRIIPILAAGLYFLLVRVTFDLFITNPFTAFLIFALATAAIFFLFAIIVKQYQIALPPKTKPQTILMICLKIFSALALGVAAWYLLKAQVILAAIVVYIICFIQVIYIFSYEKILELDQLPLKIEEDVSAGTGYDFDRLFSLAVILILSVKVFESVVSYHFKEPIILLIMAVFIAGSNYVQGKQKTLELHRDETQKIEIIDILIMLALFVIAYIIRTRQLELPGSCCDDPYTLITVQKIINGYKSVFEPDGTVIGPTLLFWLIKYMMVFTHGELTLMTPRILGAIMGSFGVVFVYLLALELFKRRVAVIAGILTTVLFILILYSRQTMWVIEVTVFAPLVMYFYIRGIKKGGVLNWILAGAGIGFGLYFYNAAKFMPILLAVFTLMYVLCKNKKKEALIRVLPGFLLSTLTAMIVYYPVLEYAIANPSSFFSRINYTSAFANIHSITALVQALVSQVVLTSKILFYTNFDNSGVFSMPGGKAIINASNTFLFILGMAAITFQWRKKENLLMLMWFVVGIMPGLFSWYYLGGGLRPILAIPAMIVIMALGLDFVVSEMEKVLGNPMKLVSPVLICTVLLFVGYLNLSDFFVGYLEDPLVKMRYDENFYNMAKFTKQYKNVNVFNSLMYNDQRFMSFNNVIKIAGVDSTQIDIPRLGLDEIYNNTGKGAVILSDSMYEKNIPLYKEYFPNAEIQTHYNLDYWIFTAPSESMAKLYTWANPLKTVNQFVADHKSILPYDLDRNSKPYIDYISCYIPYEDIKNLYGFTVSYYDGGVLAATDVSDGNVKAQTVKYDRVELNGSYDAKSYGKYAFTCVGTGLLEIFADGKQYNSGSVLMLKGLNKIRIIIRNIKQSAFTISCNMEGRPSKLVEYKDVIQSGRIYGLICKKTCEAGTYFLKYYSMRQKYYWWYKTDQPCATMDREWRGYINIKSADSYKLIFKTAYDGTVSVNGRKVFEKKAGAEKADDVFLQPGKQSIFITEKKSQPYFGESIDLLLQKRGNRFPSEVTYDQLSY